MLPLEWQAEMARLEAAIKRTNSPTKRHQPRVQRLQSARMRKVSSQSGNSIRAIYSEPNNFNGAQIATGKERFTQALGGNCENPNDAGWSSKPTQSRR
jgi:hypothetical protein